MPSSGGSSDQCHPGHVRSYSSLDHGLRVIHSGTWVGGCEAPEDHVESIHIRSPRVRTTEVRDHGQFVTVVEVEKDDDNESSGLTCHASRATTQPVPSPAPRGFVTVVAVGSSSDTSVQHHTDGVAMDTNLNLHMELSSDNAEADYVNQEMIDRERKIVQKPQAETGGYSTVPDQVVVYRLPGERLGLGLKFDGGMGAQECVRRLFIQSVAPDSPAARAAVPWGELQSGDQILNIEGCAVSSMTRVQCVSFLKDAAMKITIGVLKGNGHLPEFDTCNLEPQEYIKEEDGEENDNDDSLHLPPLIVGEMRKRVPPPPLPPRARPRKSPARPPKDLLPMPPPPSAFQDIDDESALEKHHSASLSISETPEDRDQHVHGWREFVLSRRNRPGDLGELLEDLEFHLPRSWATKRVEESMDGGLPPRPTFYLDLVGEEDAMGPCESESDETSSSVSTVIDRLSLSSSTTVSRNSSFNATADASRFDLARALSPFEQLEKELETETRPEVQQQTPATAPRDEVMSAPPVDRSTKPITTESTSPEVETSSPVSRKASSSKIKMRPSIKSFSFSLKGRPFSWQQGKGTSERVDRGTGRAETFLSIKRSGKRPAPPPPPRSIDSGTNRTDSPVTVTSTITTETSAKDKIDTTDSSTNNHEDSDNYIDLLAEAAKDSVNNTVENVAHSTCDRERNKEETFDVPTLVQAREPKLSPDYLLILDSPPGDDVIDKFSNKNFYTAAEGDVPVEPAEPAEDSDNNNIPETLRSPTEGQAEVIELCVAGQSPDSEQEPLSTDNPLDSGSPVDEEEFMLTTSDTCIETRAQVHHSVDDPVHSGDTVKCPDQPSPDSETDTFEEVCDGQDPDDSTDSQVHQTDIINDKEIDEILESDAERKVDDAEMCASKEVDGSIETDDGREYSSTETDYSTNVGDTTDMNSSDETAGTGLVEKDDNKESDSQEHDEMIYASESHSEHYEGFLSCSSPKTSPSEPPLEKPFPVPEAFLSDDNGGSGGDLDLYDDLYVEASVDRSRVQYHDPNNNRDLRFEQLTPALPSVPEEDSGDQDTMDENLESLYDDVAEDNVNDESEVSSQELDQDTQVTSASPSELLETKGSRTITQCVRQKRLRQDIGDLIRREMSLDDDVTVEVEEEEEVESLVECENEKELLLVMRALRQDQPGDHIRWLQDDSDEDDGGRDKGGNAGAGEATPDPGEDGSKDPPRSVDAPEAATPPPGGQSAPQDTEMAAARALSHPQGGCEIPRTPSPPHHHAAAQSPASDTTTTTLAAAAALHSLARGTSRHPHHDASHHHIPPPPLCHTHDPCHLDTGRDACSAHQLSDTATEKVSKRYIQPEDQEETQGFQSISSVFSDSAAVTKIVECEDSTESASGACDAQFQEAVTHPTGGQEGVNSSASDSDAAMVARTDTNQAGKVTSCPDDLQSLSPLTPQVKQDMNDPLAGLASKEKSAPQDDADGAMSTAGSCDAGSDGPLTPSTFCSDGEEQEDDEDGQGRSSENTPEPPDFSTHPKYTGE
ncbi:uncharacterized protein [Panulirus ornatus]|uniref:uncharacterized protein n=1 Tax=Panulirus ornatus TaxID=150431 RepID=UPI003A8756AD